MKLNLDEIRKRFEAATDLLAPKDLGGGQSLMFSHHKAVEKHISESLKDIPDLLAEVERLEKALRYCKDHATWKNAAAYSLALCRIKRRATEALEEKEDGRV